ncbi:hypothetical protein MAR_033451, partial [Mya arenaria]
VLAKSLVTEFALTEHDQNATSAFIRSTKDGEHTLDIPKESGPYLLQTRFCNKASCTKSISEQVVFEDILPTGTVTSIKLSVDIATPFCTVVVLDWIDFYAPSGINCYQWAIAGDAGGIHTIIAWQTIGRNTTTVRTCIPLPVNIYATLFGCVRAYSKCGNSITVCRPTQYAHAENQIKDTVLDFDINGMSWQTVK